MFTDEARSRLHDALQRQDNQLFCQILTPDLFVQAARLCGLPLVRSPLNLVNLVWLAVSAARNPEQSFADLLELPLKTLQDHEAFAGSDLDQLCGAARSARPRPSPCRHDPRGGEPERVSAQAFAQARQHMPAVFWLALFLLVGEEFQRRYAAVVRWQRFRLVAVDGTRLNLPDYPALRQYFGTAHNARGTHRAQAQLVLVQFPLARLPYAYALEPVSQGEVRLARRLLQGLRADDLVLLDAGYLSYGLLAQIQQQQASFVVRLQRRLNLRTRQRLGSAQDRLVCWRPKDSRGQWRREGWPRSLELRLLTYKTRGYRPLRLLTNVLSEQDVSYAQFWGLSVSEEGQVLSKGLYNWRWEIETTFHEWKRQQHVEGGLRSRTPEGIRYEVAGHVLYYLLLRWLLVEAAVEAGVAPLRLSFQEALRELQALWPMARIASAEWVGSVLQRRLRQRLASHRVPERPGRHYPRSKQERRASKRRADRRAKKAKPRRRSKAPEQPGYGQGWDLNGPQPQPAPAA